MGAIEADSALHQAAIAVRTALEQAFARRQAREMGRRSAEDSTLEAGNPSPGMRPPAGGPPGGMPSGGPPSGQHGAGPGHRRDPAARPNPPVPRVLVGRILRWHDLTDSGWMAGGSLQIRMINEGTGRAEWVDTVSVAHDSTRLGADAPSLTRRLAEIAVNRLQGRYAP